jgi:monofunctional biosynthetic peptidoglycan transglycosylase
MSGRSELSTTGAGTNTRRRRWRRFVGVLVRLVLAVVAIWFALILLYRWVDPPLTPLMLLRLPVAGTIHHDPVPLRGISPELRHAVIASEDNRFCFHHGIDWQAVSEAVDEYEVENRLRGASTITMQTARNLFLWPGGGFFRKTIEAGLALTIDALWSKERILEVYLNIIEWGDGVYGAQAAARTYFHKDAAHLTLREASLMAAVLPNPRRWSPEMPSRYTAGRARLIAERIEKLEGYFGCAQ